jgi:hypothetical protein
MLPGSLYLLQRRRLQRLGKLHSGKQTVHPSKVQPHRWGIISSIHFIANCEVDISRGPFRHLRFIEVINISRVLHWTERVKKFFSPARCRSFELIRFWYYINFMNNFNEDQRKQLSLGKVRIKSRQFPQPLLFNT